MKKNFIVCILGLCTALIFSGCAAKQLMKNQAKDEEAVEAVSVQEVEDQENNAEPEDATGENEETPVEEEQDVDVPDQSGAPVLGQKDIEDYDGYEYLYCEKIRTQSEKNEESGKMESSELSVFIPIDEYAYVSTNRVQGEYLGVSYRVELNPTIRYNANDYLPEENLEYLLESEFDPFYRSERKGAEVSEAQKTDENTVAVEAKYCQYNKYSDDYSPVYALYFLRDFGDGRTVYVEFSIDGSSTTGKTPMLLEEMKQFYDIDIAWNKEDMDKMVEDYLASGGDNTFSTGYLLFELPEGWKEDYDTGDYTTTVYAPDGDATKSNCMITFADEYIGYNALSGVDQDSLVELVKYSLEEVDMKADVSYYGETCLGLTVCAIAEDSAPDGKVIAHIYWIFSDSYIYKITAVALEGTEENPFLIVEDILENGQVQ